MKNAKKLCIAILVCSSITLAAETKHFVPFDCGEVFNVDTTFATLVETFGSENVVNARIHWGEGSYYEGTLIFPNTRDQVEVFWNDESTRSSPLLIRTRGKQNAWLSPEGFALGVDLHTVERMNRFPFRLMGFGWDYGGAVISWGKGDLPLTSRDDCRIAVRFSADFNSVPFRLIKQHGNVIGSREFSSGHPTMQLLNPTISVMMLGFPRDLQRKPSSENRNSDP